MADPPDPLDSAVLCDFLDLYLEDREAGRPRSLAEYLRRFPGHEEHVAREFLALGAAEGAGGSGEPSGDLLGHYKLLQKLGHGGQGTVFLAEDVRLRRHVALKILDGSLGGLPATRLARLKREADALSRLDHPRLCALYDLDLSGERPYFAMRYVAGETVAQRIGRAASDGGRADSEGKLLGRLPRSAEEIVSVVRFVEQAARAVHVAHEAGIVHRDLKPGNIMIDAGSEPVVLDFGLARDLSSNGATITMTGDAFGTLAYMSPEQLSGDHEIDRRTDVYSLGVTLYECLTFRRPVEAATRDSLLKGILTGQREDPTAFNPALPRDVAVVLACALDVDRGRRYPTALAFAEDLRRVREHEPILARPAGALLLLRRWAQRHPAAFAGGLATFTLLVAGLIVTLALLARVTSEQAQTKREQSRLAALRQAYLAQIIGHDKPALALRLGIEAAKSEPHPEINNILYDLLDRCYEKKTVAIGARHEFWPIGYEPIIDARGRGIVGNGGGGIVTIDFSSGETTELLAAHLPAGGSVTDAEPPHLAVTADLSRLASIQQDGELRIWDLGATPALLETRETGQALPTWIEFSPDQRRIVAGSRDGSLTIHDVASPDARIRFGLPGRRITTARWDPSGSRIVATSLAGTGHPSPGPAAAVFDAATGERLSDLGSGTGLSVWASWSPSGSLLAVALDSRVKVFRTADWAEEASFLHADLVYWISFHPDGRRVVTGSRDGVSVWDIGTRARTAVVGDFRDRSVIRGAFSPDGSRLAAIAWDQTAAIFACDTWQEVRKLRGMGRPRGVCWSPDGALLATSDETNAVHAWYPGDRPHLPVLRGHGDRVVAAAFHPGGTRALTASLDGSARIFDTGTGKVRQTMIHGKPLSQARFTATGKEVVTIGGGRVMVWDAERGTRIQELLVAGVPAVDAWPLESGAVFVTYEDGTARQWDVDRGAVARVFEGHRGPILCATFHPARFLAATGGSDRSARVWDLRTGKEVATLAFPAPDGPASGADLSRVFVLCFDKSGNRLVAGCEDLRVRIWDVSSGRLEREVSVATPGMLAVDPTGRWLMSGAKWTGRVGFHDLGGSNTPPRTTPLQDSHMISAIRFSPDGTFAMAASWDGTVRLWNMDSIRPHATFNAKCGILLEAEFSPDSQRVIVAGSDGTARIWPVEPLSVAELTCPVSQSFFGSLKDVVDQALPGR